MAFLLFETIAGWWSTLEAELPANRQHMIETNSDILLTELQH